MTAIIAKARAAKAGLSNESNKSLSHDTFWGLGLEESGSSPAWRRCIFLARDLGAGPYGNYAAVYAVMAPFMGVAYAALSLVVGQALLRDREDPRATISSCLGILVCSNFLLATGAVFIVTLVVPSCPFSSSWPSS